MNKPKIVCVVGPTASGKTAFAVALAKERNGEVISCDSMQIYQGMQIGTAKPTQEEMDGVPHHMIDFVDPATRYSVADFVEDARRCIQDVLEREKLPVLCGGTGLYLDSILNQIEFHREAYDEAYRMELTHIAEEQGVDAVHHLLRMADPVAAEEIHPNNVKRVIRALEIIKSTGLSKQEADAKARGVPRYDAEIYGLRMDRERLYDRINRRVDLMMEAGLLREVEELLERGIPKTSTAMQAIGYKELVCYLEGNCSLEEAVETIKRESRRYAKRQMTWFKRNPEILWLDR